MKHIRGPCQIVALFALWHAHAHAQTPTTQFLPELGADVGINQNVRFVFQAKQTLDGNGLYRAEVGPSIQFYSKPIRILRDVTIFDLDETKPVPLVMAIGYRVLAYPDAPTVNRLQPLVVIHVPFWGRILTTDENRADMDWLKGTFYWRYRNRVTLERRLTIRSYHPGPYASGEFFYASRYDKWSNTRLYAGCILALGKHVDLDPYYQHDNNTGPRPNQQVNAAGIILNLYLPRSKK